MLQKAMLQIDNAKGVKKDNRFRTGAKGASGALQTLTKTVNDASKALKKGISSVSPGSIAMGIVDAENGMITVQYNPASIKYRAAAMAQRTSSQDVGETTENIKPIPRISMVDMSFRLVFHSTGDDDESVRDQMELIMNMICNSPTKKATFSWGKIAAAGKLVSFSGEYDMFDDKGRPISGHMDMTIRTQADAKQEARTLGKIEDERSSKEAKSESSAEAR